MKLLLMLTLLFTALTIPAQAQQTATNPATQPATTLSEGEVRKVDMDAKKITIRHGPIANLGMPPMTMVFQVKDPALLERAKTGDKVRFSAEQSSGAYFVTRIDPVQ